VNSVLVSPMKKNS